MGSSRVQKICDGKTCEYLFYLSISNRSIDLGYFDNVMIEWSKKENWGYFSQFCILGNFMFNFHREKFHFAFEGYDEPGEFSFEISLYPSTPILPTCFYFTMV